MSERLSGGFELAKIFAEEIGLKWPLTAKYGNVGRPRILSFPQHPKRHEIVYPYGLKGRTDRRNLNYFETSTAHEIGHAWLAENIDTNLASAIIDTREGDPQHIIKLQVIDQITDFVDVWASDVVVDILDRKDLIKEQIKLWLTGSRRLQRANTNTFMLEFATSRGLAERHGIKPMQSRLQKVGFEARRNIGIVQAEKMGQLTEVCAQLSFITHHPEGGLEEYEKAADQYADILEVELRPRLVHDSGVYMWRFS